MTTIRRIKTIATRAEATLLADAAGAAALMLILTAGLYLPAFV
ncbi:MAG: hypothetical protein AAGF60_04220 [Pseudomonadota bacterium]